ncbi:MAG: hypothetical protein LAO77_00005, partial [Acidobacteriia bacterium]|nr:hypothetical protein [Terriglobia bacterium]
MTSSIRRRARVLALVGLSALMAVLLFSTRVYAQGFNAAGTPNTAFTFGGGGLGDETIAYTAPSGFLGTGTYGVVFDNCQDGKFDAGVDQFFYPAFQVVIPSGPTPILPNAAIAAVKLQAHDMANVWTLIKTGEDIQEFMEQVMSALECFASGPFACAVSTAIDEGMDYVKAQALAALGLRDPSELRKATELDIIAHYGGIAADPPDPNYQQVTPLGPVAHLQDPSDDPIIQRLN